MKTLQLILCNTQIKSSTGYDMINMDSASQKLFPTHVWSKECL